MNRPFDRESRVTPGLLSLLFCAARLILVAEVSRAGPPFVTDDPEPVDFRNWEVYIASNATDLPAGTSGTLPQIEVNYGVVPNLQLHVIFPVAFCHPAGAKTERGYSDTEIGAKYRFVQERKNRPMVGIFPHLEIPTGSAARGLGTGHVQLFLPVWLEKNWGKWKSYGGGGYWINPGEGNRNYWFLGWEAQKDINSHLMLGGEIFLTTPSAVDAGSQWVYNLGAQLNVDDNNHVLFSIGRHLHGDVDSMFYLGYQLTFGPQKAEDIGPGGR
jgi:hypothetical protein